MTLPQQPKIYHILHIDRLSSIINDQYLWCDSESERRKLPGTKIGMSHIKKRRLDIPLNCYPTLQVGDCVPFYFCPRSVMLYIIHKNNHPDICYSDGQDHILHLEADLYASVEWAENNSRRWAFTLSNAGSNYFEVRNNLNQLNELDWSAINNLRWSGEGVPGEVIEHKQAEFLMEHHFPWELIERIGVKSRIIYDNIIKLFDSECHRPKIEIMSSWYY